MKTASSARQHVKKLARKLQSNGQMQHKADIDMAKKAREVELLERACGAMGLELTREGPILGKVNGMQICYSMFDSKDYWIDDTLRSLEQFGKTQTFDSLQGFKPLKNIFFGVKTAEELAVRLDLMGA